MNTAIARKTNIQDTDNLIILINDVAQLEDFSLSEEEMDYAIKCLDTEQINFALNQYKRWIFIQVLSDSKESARKAANTLHNSVVDNKISEVSVINAMANKAVAFAFTEGLALSNYQFLKYFSDKKDCRHY